MGGRWVAVGRVETRAYAVRRQAAGGATTASAVAAGDVGDRGDGQRRRRGVCARVAGRSGVASRHAGARRVPDARVAHRVVEQAARAAAAAADHGPHAAQAILAQESFELAVLLCESLLVLRDVAVDLFQAKNLVFESFDVELLALAVCSEAADCIVLVAPTGFP